LIRRIGGAAELSRTNRFAPMFQDRASGVIHIEENDIRSAANQRRAQPARPDTLHSDRGLRIEVSV
jgi:hypothetical protein